ncbi:MAG TPA: hypothetical protein VF484_09365, partial [Candidatus Limnocylindrales bacterium]
MTAVGLDPAAWTPQAGAVEPDVRWLPRERLDDLLAGLRRDGRRLVGPTLRDGAIEMAEIETAADLPFGWTASSVPGRVELARADGERAATRAFDTGTAWRGIKPWTFPARVEGVGFETASDGRVTVRVDRAAVEPLAVIGARACDLAALAIHDRVLTGGAAIDEDYAARRADLFVVAVECALATATCFCASMRTGPEVSSGADIVLAELDGGFAAKAASAAGRTLLDALALSPATAATGELAERQVAATRAAMRDGVELAGLRERLLANLDHPR